MASLASCGQVTGWSPGLSYVLFFNFFFFFDLDHFLKVFIEFVTIVFLFFFNVLFFWP